MSDLFIVGVDGSEGSRRALYYAGQLARQVGAGLLVVHVLPDAPGGDLAPTAPELAFGQQEQEVEAAHARMLEPLVAEARELGLYVEVKALHGDPATVLAELAAVREARQIVIGRQPHSRLHDFLLGSTLSSLAKKTTVPVTLVP